MTPFFSIIVPVYNAEKYLIECIESVIHQSMSDFELLLVDDGSTDSSGRICDKYSLTNRQIHTFHQSNSGQLCARQHGIRQSTGKYLMFLDADDYLEQNTLDRIKQAIRDTGSDCVIFGFNRVYDGRIISTTDKSFSDTVISDKSKLYKRVFFEMEYNPHWRKAVNASLMSHSASSDYNTVMIGEDLIQSLEIYKKISSAVFIPDCLYNYRINSNSVTHSVSAVNFDCDMRARAETLFFLRQEDCFSKEDMIIYSRFCRRLLIISILEIARMHEPVNQKFILIKKMRSTKYCEEVIKASGTASIDSFLDAVLWKLFVLKKFRIIIMPLSLLYKLKLYYEV